MSLFLPYSIGLLEQYKKGVVAQLAILSRNNQSDGADYQTVKKILNNINLELQILRSL